LNVSLPIRKTELTRSRREINVMRLASLSISRRYRRPQMQQILARRQIVSAHLASYPARTKRGGVLRCQSSHRLKSRLERRLVGRAREHRYL
jgi:hypothetical protein